MMREATSLLRHNGCPRRDQSDTEVPEVQDDGDPVLRASSKQCKQCGGGKKSRSRSDSCYLAVGLLAFVVLGYLSAFGATRQLREEHQEHRQSSQERDQQKEGLLAAGQRDGSEGAEVGERPARDVVKSTQVLDADAGGKSSRSWNKPDVSGTVGNSDEEESVDGGLDHGRDFRLGSKPNVFFFLVDDMGHADIGYQCSDLRELTPNLNALAAGGIKLSSYYSLSKCTPARASLMTGRYPVRLGMQYSVISPGQPWGLPLDEKILPEYMNDAGYESHMVGKWHLGSYNYASLPNNRGFDTYLGYLNGEDDYWTHQNLDAYLDGDLFYDFGFGNETDYYDVTGITEEGHPCLSLQMLGGDRERGHDYAEAFLLHPTDVCYTGGYPTDAFLGRAHQA